VKVEGKDVFINAENDFAQKQLERSKEILQAILKNVLNHECTMHLGIAENQKKGNDLEDTIRVLFDSEEVR
jgi:hypothetical protein